MALLENRSGVQIVGGFTTPAAIDDQLAAFSSPKFSGLINRGPTIRTLKTIWVKVFDDPVNTALII